MKESWSTKMILFRKQILVTCLLLAAGLPGCTPAPAPTVIPTNIPSGTQEPCIDISVSPTTLKVGETTTVTGTADAVEKTYFFGLQIKDADAKDFSMLLNLPDSGTPQPAKVSQVLEFDSANYIDHGRVVLLRARQAGSAKVAFFMSGNSACADPAKGGVISEIVTITVNP
jgi:hypothetical protein